MEFFTPAFLPTIKVGLALFLPQTVLSFVIGIAGKFAGSPARRTVPRIVPPFLTSTSLYAVCDGANVGANASIPHRRVKRNERNDILFALLSHFCMETGGSGSGTAFFMG